MKSTLPVESVSPLSIGVLVLNYNTWDLALRALKAAIDLEQENVKEYVLFDDGSPTSPPEGIDRQIRLVLGRYNRGFSRALAAAFSVMSSDIVVVFDSDACPLVPFSAQVRKRFQNDPSLGQLGFVAQDQNGFQTESYLGEPTPWSLILGQALYSRLPKRRLRASKLCVITGCMSTRLEAYTQAGGFDQELDFLDVDVDYSMRLRKLGWRIDVDTSIKVFHVGGGTPQQVRARVLRFYKCRWYVLRKHGLILNPSLARKAISFRLVCEDFLLRTFGWLLFKDSSVREDKILGRRELLSYCRANFF